MFLAEVRRALTGESLRGESFSALDFSLYERELQSREEYAHGNDYFLGLAEGAVPAVLPDSPSPDGKRVGTFALSIPAGEVNRFYKDLGVTPGSFFQAVFGETLRRVTGEEKILYVTTSGGRSAFPGLMDSVGMFAKTLPVVSKNPGEMTVREYVREVHRQLSETYARECCPCTELLKSRGIIPETMFIYQGGISEQEPSSITLEPNATRQPFYVDFLAQGQVYVFHVTYDGRRYSRSAVETFAGMVKHIALGFVREKYVKDVK